MSIAKTVVHTTGSGIRFHRQRNHGIQVVYSPDSEKEKGLNVGDILISIKTNSGPPSNNEQVFNIILDLLHVICWINSHCLNLA